MAETENVYTDPKNYVNRELSWLEFNYRILNESRDKAIPLFERLKFLSITASNLDEFCMVRVASLKDQVHAKYKKTDIAGLRADEQLALISEKTHRLVDLQYSTYSRSLLPAFVGARGADGKGAAVCGRLFSGDRLSGFNPHGSGFLPAVSSDSK